MRRRSVRSVGDPLNEGSQGDPFDPAQSEDHRIAVSMGSFNSEVWAEKDRRTSLKRPPSRLRGPQFARLSVRTKVDPSPSVLFTVIDPPCTSMMCFTIASPRPEPPSLRARLRPTR